MTNVYNQSVFEKNSIQEVPKGYIDDTANNLFRFMGNFWKNIHEGNGLIRGIQKVRGIKLAQFYLDLLETLKLQDRRGLPVYHRELWKPLIIRKSTRNTAQENVIKLDGEAVLGEQPSGSKYGEGTVLQIGNLASLDKYVTYPVDKDFAEIISGITDSVINPNVSYKVDKTFPSENIVYMNGTLIIPKDKDPFGENSPFYIYDVVDDVTEDVEGDQETVLWASDVLIDRNYISDHMAYALGINCPSTDIIKRILNAGWDALNCGLTPGLFRTLVAAMLNIPVIQDNTEKITSIVNKEGQDKRIVTDKHTYTVYAKAKLRTKVRIGAELTRGEFLDESVKVYPLLTDVSKDKLSGITEYADILKTDVPVISVPRTILRTNTSNGLSVDWTPTDVIDTLERDANGNRKLYFEVGGSEEDVTAFWEDVWKHAEKAKVAIEDYFVDCGPEEDTESSESDPVWKIIPAKFFLKYMLGGNTLIVTMDRDQVEDSSLLRDSMFFDILNRVMPSGMRLFFIEHVMLDEDDDTYRMGEDADGYADTEEIVDKYVLEDIDDEIDYSDMPGMRGKRMPTYEDQIEMKLYRNRKRKAENER